mmetsp:Transcript_14334/g.18114  ORF Transcript_14334/g.18114 Transcript_14334/m.18114 type:complete len:199 (-) Transcript_14334:63-659(-)
MFMKELCLLQPLIFPFLFEESSSVNDGDWMDVNDLAWTSEWTMVDPSMERPLKEEEEEETNGGLVDDDDFVVLKGRDNKNEDAFPSMTQVGIEELKDDLEELKGMVEMNKSAAKSHKTSENQQMITVLGEEVYKVKHKLEVREKDRLYSDSITSTLEDERDELKEQLEFERKRCYCLEKENKEYEENIFFVRSDFVGI